MKFVIRKATEEDVKPLYKFWGTTKRLYGLKESISAGDVTVVFCDGEIISFIRYSSQHGKTGDYVHLDVGIDYVSNHIDVIFKQMDVIIQGAGYVKAKTTINKFDDLKLVISVFQNNGWEFEGWKFQNSRKGDMVWKYPIFTRVIRNVSVEKFGTLI